MPHVYVEFGPMQPGGTLPESVRWEDACGGFHAYALSWPRGRSPGECGLRIARCLAAALSDGTPIADDARATGACLDRMMALADVKRRFHVVSSSLLDGGNRPEA